MKKFDYKWILLLGLFIIPFIFILLITIIGMVVTFINDNNFVFDLISYWRNGFSIWYYWILSFLLSIIVYFYFLYKVWFTKKEEASLKATKQKDYGNANWLTKKEINRLYPLVNDNHNQHGFVVNSRKSKNIIFYNLRTNTHSLVIGGTGSGKTQGLVLPTISINAKSQIKPSMVITDIKGELYQNSRTIIKRARL